MLGKTNITVLKEGTAVSEVEDFTWILQESGTNGNFVKAVYKNGCLAAITEDGNVAYTTDGEVWQTSCPCQGCRLNDIEWDGDKFVVVGRCVDPDDASSTKGLIATSTDLNEFSIVTGLYDCEEILCVFYENGKFVLPCIKGGIRIVYTDLTKEGTSDKGWYNVDPEYTSFGKNENGILLFANCHVASNKNFYSWLSFFNLDNSLKLKDYTGLEFKFKTASVFECKDTLYAMGLHSTTGYGLEKVTDSNEVMTVSTGKNFMFVDGVYFDGCQLFINRHEMLVVKKGESIADKTLDDLIEIAPEQTMNCIVKAFGNLYIFGNRGVILRSSSETGNQAAIAVQAMSARKALAEANKYTDEKLEALEKDSGYIVSTFKTQEDMLKFLNDEEQSDDK